MNDDVDLCGPRDDLLPIYRELCRGLVDDRFGTSLKAAMEERFVNDGALLAKPVIELGARTHRDRLEQVRSRMEGTMDEVLSDLRNPEAPWWERESFEAMVRRHARKANPGPPPQIRWPIDRQ